MLYAQIYDETRKRKWKEKNRVRSRGRLLELISPVAYSDPNGPVGFGLSAP